MACYLPLSCIHSSVSRVCALLCTPSHCYLRLALWPVCLWVASLAPESPLYTQGCASVQAAAYPCYVGRYKKQTENGASQERTQLTWLLTTGVGGLHVLHSLSMVLLKPLMESANSFPFSTTVSCDYLPPITVVGWSQRPWSESILWLVVPEVAQS